MDIVVTTPASESASARAEAAEVIANGAGTYFRRLSSRPTALGVGDRVYYAERGYIRGYAIVSGVSYGSMICDTTGNQFADGWNVIMDAATWRWIRPVRMRGFQGYRYARFAREDVVELGGWLDPMPTI